MNALVVHCHPSTSSLTTASRHRLEAALRTGGHEVRSIDLYAEGFEPRLSAWERRHHLDDPATKPDIAAHARLLGWCDTLFLTYPTWWSGQPAMLKGWFDRVWVNGVAYTLPEGSDRVRPLLRNIRRIVVVTSHGSSKALNVMQGEGGRRVVTRAMRAVCHPRCRTSWIALYRADSLTADRAERFHRRVERVARRLPRVSG